MPLKIIQKTKINTGDFVFANPETVSIPVAPLVSAKFYPSVGEPLALKIRATLYINSKESNEPTIKEPTIVNNALHIYYDCDFSKKTPETSDVWYIELDYTSTSIKIDSITEIVSFLRDTNSSNVDENQDPPTSRGTETSTRYP
ncbi:MAG TPA: hypothetical protein VFS71_02020 [Flavobacterium sp.]|uniref:hypothetical protein n=1 Tax=Flavobacterium sp. TaxID=239 RepID=UPI002DBB2F87|nr:hypothetical protein [Flavobacterium sp.]HEU4788434.1 hypothetical protein [Flavobacterium sp.]